MTEEKKIILNKIDKLISKRKADLLKELPDVHEVDDGIIIRFFTEWDNCESNNNIKFKNINNLDNPDEIVVFFYLPQGAFFNCEKKKYISCITCLNGKIEINVNNETRLLNSFDKICINTNNFQGKALENTYLITTNM